MSSKNIHITCNAVAPGPPILTAICTHTRVCRTWLSILTMAAIKGAIWTVLVRNAILITSLIYMLTCSSKVDNKTNAQLILSHSIQEHIRSCFSFAPFALKLTLYKLKCILANSRRTKLFTSIERQKLHGTKMTLYTIG